jgi:hypothetical protein
VTSKNDGWLRGSRDTLGGRFRGVLLRGSPSVARASPSLREPRRGIRNPSAIRDQGGTMDRDPIEDLYRVLLVLVMVSAMIAALHEFLP